MFIFKLHRDLRIIGCVIWRPLKGVLARASRCLLLRTPTLALGWPNVAAAHVTILLFSIRPMVLADKRGGVQSRLSTITPQNSIVNPLETGLTRHCDDRVLRPI